MITAILVLVVLGVALYLIETYVPMAPPFKIVIRLIIIVFSILYLLRVFGISDFPVR
jgi:hypothetical protein